MSQMPTIQAKTSDLVIFGRLLRNGNGKMSPRLARYVLTLGFNPDDQARMKDLGRRLRTLSIPQKLIASDRTTTEYLPPSFPRLQWRLI